MAAPAGYDRLSALKAFDATKAGVKGLVDAGATAVPPIFHHPPDPHHHDASCTTRIIPVIDLAAAATRPPELVAQVKAAAETVGFFQVVNHGVPEAAMSDMLAAVKRFNEEPAEARRPYYTRDPARRFRYQSNFDLFHSPAANWRDTIFLEMAPAAARPAPEDMPPAFRGVVSEYAAHVQRLAAALLGLLSEAMGLDGGYLERDAGGLDVLSVVGHYYPPCPEPHLTLGTTRHSDPSVLTVLLQDGVGGLQVLLGGWHVDDERRWVDVAPVAGALVVNIGDFLQLMSNDRFKSVEHRVVAMHAGPRLSVACFFRGHDAGATTRVYGPILSDGERARYKSVTVEEFVGYYRNKGLDGRSALDQFRI